MKTRKYNYLKVIQQYYGQGWEDVSQYDKNEDIRHDLKEYRLTGYPIRVVNRRELNQINK